MTDIEKIRVKSLWESGMALSQIRRVMSMTNSEFRTGINEMRKEGAFNSERKNNVAKVCRDYDEGERDVRKIAKTYGLTVGTVYQYLQKNGRLIGFKKQNYTHCQRSLDIAEDIKEKTLSLGDIAKRHGVSRQYVFKIKKKIEKGIL